MAACGARPGDRVRAEIRRTLGRLKPSSFKYNKRALQDFKMEREQFLFLGLLMASLLPAWGLAAAFGANPLGCLAPLGSPSRARAAPALPELGCLLVSPACVILPVILPVFSPVRTHYKTEPSSMV